jgi:hypothetical protein
LLEFYLTNAELGSSSSSKKLKIISLQSQLKYVAGSQFKDKSNFLSEERTNGRFPKSQKIAFSFFFHRLTFANGFTLEKDKTFSLLQLKTAKI